MGPIVVASCPLALWGRTITVNLKHSVWRPVTVYHGGWSPNLSLVGLGVHAQPGLTGFASKAALEQPARRLRGRDPTWQLAAARAPRAPEPVVSHQAPPVHACRSPSQICHVVAGFL